MQTYVFRWFNTLFCGKTPTCKDTENILNVAFLSVKYLTVMNDRTKMNNFYISLLKFIEEVEQETYTSGVTTTILKTGSCLLVG